MQSSKNNQYTASDIERYHAGKMSAEEMHTLEKASLDDPFLADALEGYVFTSSPTEDLMKLQNKLNERLDKKKAVPSIFINFNWLKAAAVFIVLAGSGWLVYKNFSTENRSIALAPQQEKQKARTDSVSSVTQIPPIDSGTLHRGEIGSTLKTNDTGQSLAAGKLTMIQHQSAKEKQADSDAQNQLSSIAIQTEAGNLSNDASRRNADSKDDNNTYQNNARSKESNYSRNEVNAGNKNLPEISTNNIPAGRQVTANNNAWKNNYDSTNRTIVLQGKTDGVIKNDTIKDLNVVMKEMNSAHAEVVVVGHGVKKQATGFSKLPTVIIDTLEPAEGFIRYDDYIATNIKMPEEQKIKPGTREVQLSFEVNNDGDPVNIRVIKSLCTQCDDEAVRLLKEGPKWKKRKNKKGKLTIRF